MITTSEVAVSLTIDNNYHLSEIKKELKTFGKVTVEKKQAIVCVVGNFISENRGLATQVFNAVSDIPIRMISYGGSRYNISVLVPSSHKESTLRTISENLLDNGD